MRLELTRWIASLWLRFVLGKLTTSYWLNFYRSDGLPWTALPVILLEGWFIFNHVYFGCNLSQLFFELISDSITSPVTLNTKCHLVQEEWRKYFGLFWLFGFFWLGGALTICCMFEGSRWGFWFKILATFAIFLLLWVDLHGPSHIVSWCFGTLLKAWLTELILLIFLTGSPILFPPFFFGSIPVHLSTGDLTFQLESLQTSLLVQYRWFWFTSLFIDLLVRMKKWSRWRFGVAHEFLLWFWFWVADGLRAWLHFWFWFWGHFWIGPTDSLRGTSVVPYFQILKGFWF